MTTPKALARTAGVLYLLLAGAAFNEGYVLPRIVKSGDAAATAGTIRASATLFRVGFVGDMVAATCWVLLAMALYLLLNHVHQLAAAAMVTFAVVGATIQYLNQLNQYTALTIATSDHQHRTALHRHRRDRRTVLPGLAAYQGRERAHTKQASSRHRPARELPMNTAACDGTTRAPTEAVSWKGG